MSGTYSAKDICAYLTAMRSAASTWVEAFANEPNIQDASYWGIFSELYLKGYDDKRPIQLKEICILIPDLSPSTIRRKIEYAEDRGFVILKKVEGIRSPYVELTDKTITIIENACSQAMRTLGVTPDGPNTKRFSSKEICTYIKAMREASSSWIKAFIHEQDMHASYCWQLCTEFYLKTFGEGRPVAFKDAAKFIPTLSAQHTGRIIKAAQERGYLTQSPNIEMTDKSKLIIGEVCTQAMDGFSKEFGVSFGLSDQRA